MLNLLAASLAACLSSQLFQLNSGICLQLLREEGSFQLPQLLKGKAQATQPFSYLLPCAIKASTRGIIPWLSYKH